MCERPPDARAPIITVSGDRTHIVVEFDPGDAADVAELLNQGDT